MLVDRSPRLEAVIRAKVNSGRCANALMLMESRDKVERLRAAIASAGAQFAYGKYSVWTKHSMPQLLEEAKAEERRGSPISQDVLP